MLPIKKYLFVDLDNTIYAVKSMGTALFAPILALIKNSGKHVIDFDVIQIMLTRKPFQYVAQQFNFDDELLAACLQILTNLKYDGILHTYDDYSTLKNIPCKKILVTAGFTQLQQSKIKQLGIMADFEAIYIIDQTQQQQTKKDIFEMVLQQNNWAKNDVLVIGDDANSEIAAAQLLGIDAVLIDKIPDNLIPPHIQSVKTFKELEQLFTWQ